MFEHVLKLWYNDLRIKISADAELEEFAVIQKFRITVSDDFSIKLYGNNKKSLSDRMKNPKVI